MKNHLLTHSGIKFLLLALLLLFACPVAADDECQASGGYGFVCGPQNAEDLVLVPGTEWIIASGMASGAAILLIDSQQKTWTELYPGGAPRGQQDMEIYAACSGPPETDNFVTHGLNLRPGENGHSTLYVVGHGGREAIEVFDVNARGERPVLTWTGCIMMPGGMAANSVASFSDGSLVATIPLHTGKTIAESMTGLLTGAVYQWSPGDSGFEMIQGTELPYGNSIEVSADEQEIYVAATGLGTIVAYSRSNPARQLRNAGPLAFIPDNIHRGVEGSLITAGMVINYPPCDSKLNPDEFDLAAFAACPRPVVVRTIDPQSMEVRDLMNAPAHQKFSNATMALEVGGEIWIGTFSGDRIGYRSLQEIDH
jgi:hypothetical protein